MFGWSSRARIDGNSQMRSPYEVLSIIPLWNLKWRSWLRAIKFTSFFLYSLLFLLLLLPLRHITKRLFSSLDLVYWFDSFILPFFLCIPYSASTCLLPNTVSCVLFFCPRQLWIASFLGICYCCFYHYPQTLVYSMHGVDSESSVY